MVKSISRQGDYATKFRGDQPESSNSDGQLDLLIRGELLIGFPKTNCRAKSSRSRCIPGKGDAGDTMVNCSGSLLGMVTLRKRSEFTPTSPAVQAPSPAGRMVSTRMGSAKSGPLRIWPGWRGDGFGSEDAVIRRYLAQTGIESAQSRRLCFSHAPERQEPG